jgi:hypothetical protein
LFLETTERMGRSDDVVLATIDILVAIFLPLDIDLNIDIGSPVAEVSAPRPGLKDNVDRFGVSVGFGRDFDRFEITLRVLCTNIS